MFFGPVKIQNTKPLRGHNYGEVILSVQIKLIFRHVCVTKNEQKLVLHGHFDPYGVRLKKSQRC